MTHLLDTDVCIDYLRGRDYARRAIAQAKPSDLAISVVTVAELMIGALGARQPTQEKEKVETFVTNIRVIDFGYREALVFAEIMTLLRIQGQTIGEMDSIIAATAKTNGPTVVTRNQAHFVRVEGLEVVNWLT